MWDKISEFIVPAVLLFLYLLVSGKKKTSERPRREGNDTPEPVYVKRRSPPEPTWESPPPVRREQRVLHSAIEDRSLESKLSGRKLVSAINERGAPLSAGLLEHIAFDPSYAKAKKKSRAKHLLGTRSSLRRAILMQEIFSPPQL